MSALNGMSAATVSGWLAEIRANAPRCEAIRSRTRKPQQTGTISESACVYLRSIVERVRPRVVVEVGTFIGTSALVLASTGGLVFTCDKDNDAFMSTHGITVFGKTGSTSMLQALVDAWKADLFFFDGRIQDDDLPLIQRMSHQRTVYAFDDYEGREKGVINVEKLFPQLGKGYRLRPPPEDVYGLPSRTTIAVLAPKGSML